MRKLIAVSLLCGIVAFVLFVFIIIFGGPSFPSAKNALPVTATDVRDFYIGESDYIHCLIAKITKDEYNNYALKLGFTERYNENDPFVKQYVDQKFSRQPDWWNPPPADSETFIKVDREDKHFDYISTLRHRNGIVYYYSSSW